MPQPGLAETHVEFPASSSWTWVGKERRIFNDSVTNCGHGTVSLGVNESYGTTHGASVSVGMNAEFGYKSVGTVVHSWRGRGCDRIWSFSYYVDAYADVVNPDGTPAMDYVARDKPGSC
ncbi:hypothetical protein AB0I51_29200 [Streptomyces sp. NPDC050549]|uniref:hypothetical protein n=1 Tax=Streptomyces sp. NPDC050549 TaxID=3155406 RepID=UPI003428C03B